MAYTHDPKLQKMNDRPVVKEKPVSISIERKIRAEYELKQKFKTESKKFGRR
jgi:hypothetical protein